MKCLVRLTVIAAMLLASSCGFHQGVRRDSDTRNDLQYRLDVSGVQYSRTASGSSDIGSLFCLIPFGTDPYKTAMENLQKDAKLQKNEVLTNYRDDMGLSGIVYIWCNFRLTVSADVLTLTPKDGGGGGASTGFTPPPAVD
jgi:hypothetical protein